MINLLLGAPGGGKSYEAVAYHVLPALAKGRKVITNLPLNVEKFAEIDPSFPALIEVRKRPCLVLGTFDLSDAEEGAFRVGEEPEIAPAGQRVFGGVWDYYSTWRHEEKAFGPLFVIDECHEALPRMRCDKAVEEWYARHRHFNVDVLLMTQSYGKISDPIRDLVQIVYRVRKNVALGSTSTYTRKVQDGIRGAVVNTSQRAYQKRYFGLYKSHTQGEAIEEFNASDVRPLWRHPLFLATYVLLGLPVILMGCGVLPTPWGSLTKPAATLKPLEFKNPGPVSAKLEEVERRPEDGKVAKAQPEKAVVRESPTDVDPLESKGVHLVGYIKFGDRELYRFMVSANGVEAFETDDVQLRKTGYRWRPGGECFGWLTYGKATRAVSCDAPQVAASLGGRPTGNTSATNGGTAVGGVGAAGAIVKAR